ncbi:MAG TPA: serine hydrolase domain-containing protein [Anaerolineales bacterium]|nr:serine hydrolase domain-containing protein [Anaerolineales bacterium]
MKTKIIEIISALMLATMLISAASQTDFASASAQTSVVEQAATQPPEPIDPEELEAFLDDLMAAEMTENHIPGAMVAVVEDGSLLLAKGYGYADLEGRVPVDPERTLFRIGSVSKLFTWTAVMQLVEQGQLSLDTDVNEYLDFAIPATFPEPITLRHLLSHTAGFEDKGSNMHKLQVEQMNTLGDYLKANLPGRVFSPGEVVAYSNYGTSLAGYIVERVSGLPFSEYVEQKIFAPLDMAHSSFRQPLPETLAADLATGYNYHNGQYVAGSFVFDQSYPAGAVSATATDMARFMIAHLQNGELDSQRILREETARQMHSQLYTPDPRLNGGMAYGFFENMINGQRVISHGGSLVTFMSQLILIPEQNVGLYISTNSSRGAAAKDAVVNAFLDRYYPVAEASDLQSAAGFAERIAPYLGEYTPVRNNFTTYERIYGVFSTINASLDSDGTLVISQLGRVLRFAEMEPGLLQDISDPSNKLVYRTDPDGRLFLTVVAGYYEPWAVFRTPWYGTRNLHMVLFLSGTLLFLGALIAWPIGFFVGRRKQPATAQPAPLPARLARWAAAFFGLLWLVILLGITSLFINILPGFGVPRIILETPPLLSFLLALSYVLVGLALAILVFAVLAWVRRYWSLGGRIFYSLLALMALLLTWSLVYWNLFL